MAVGVFITRPPAATADDGSCRSCRPTPQTIYWRVEVLGDNQELSLHVQKVHDLPPGKSHELWALPEGGAPVSLGLMPHTGDHHRVLNAAQRAALAARSRSRSASSPRGLADRRSDRPVLLVAPLSTA